MHNKYNHHNMVVNKILNKNNNPNNNNILKILHLLQELHKNHISYMHVHLQNQNHYFFLQVTIMGTIIVITILKIIITILIHTLINTIHFIDDDEHGSVNYLPPPPPPDGELAPPQQQQQQQQIYIAATHASHNVTLSQQSLRWQKPSRVQYELNSKDFTTLYNDAYLCFQDLTPETTADITNTTKIMNFLQRILMQC
eukprot:UN09599